MIQYMFDESSMMFRIVQSLVWVEPKLEFKRKGGGGGFDRTDR